MERFFKNTQKKENGCIEWIGALRNGYGAFKYKGKVRGSHRFAWTLKNGKIPDGLLVCHKCDNPKCVNVDHLFLGTYKDNFQDALDKKRIKSIEKQNSPSKIGKLSNNRNLKTKSDIEKVKNYILRNYGKFSLKEISEKLNLPYTLIRDINSGRTYKNI